MGYDTIATPEEEFVAEAQRPHKKDILKKSPDGKNTRGGGGGRIIGGGEEPLRAARRLLQKAPPLLFFDEATSALDTHTEQALMANINSILREKGRTSVFVAHRLRTIFDADLIIVLREGAVAEMGTHQQLID
ncbi:hypothetical protein jhhlp_007976, partial [Lomentospora prolificans]